MTNLFDKATDPTQYDKPETGWKDHGGKGLENPSRRHMLYYIETLVPRWQGRKVLDIGTGTGWLPEYVAAQGAAIADGFDPSLENVRLAREQFGVEVIPATVENFTPAPGIQYDTLVAIYVLSHIADLDLAFSRIASWMEVDGNFIAIVPDLQYAVRPRANFDIKVEPIAGSHYGDFVVSVKRDHGEIADIVRAVETYREAAKPHGLELTAHTEMKATDIMVNAYPRYAQMRDENVTLTHLLQFTKRAEG